MLRVTDNIEIPLSEITIEAIRAAGPGGQHVNKASTAIHLRFDVGNSEALPDELKERVLAYPDRRISADGIIVIKSRRFRSREKNRQDALERLADLIEKAAAKRQPRIPTRPGKKAKRKRLESKSRRGSLKRLRQPPRDRE